MTASPQYSSSIHYRIISLLQWSPRPLIEIEMHCRPHPHEHVAAMLRSMEIWKAIRYNLSTGCYEVVR